MIPAQLLRRPAARLAWPFGRPAPRRATAAELLRWCEDLAAAPGAFAPTLADRVLDGYEASTPPARQAVLAGLSARFAPDAERLDRAVAAFQAGRGPDALAELHAASEPRRQQLLRNLNLARDGTARLVRLRADLLAWRGDIPAAAALDNDLSHLLASWFNAGFLGLERISWTSPASLLRKIIAYEAVHEIGDWEELRRRVEPADRRCYAFFHARMPDEPLIFVEVALTRAVPDSIRTLLSPARTPCPPERAHTAVFYSISNCQAGLKGIPFGSVLIKQVAACLQAELPDLRTFVTLSPIPGLRAWTQAQVEDPRLGRTAREALAADAPPPEHVRRLAANYLLAARTSLGEPLDPVGRFHLGNGASILAIRPGADPSNKAVRQSFGAMVNYRYELDDLERNRLRLTTRGEVRAARRVQAEARRPAPSDPGRRGGAGP